MLGNNLANEIEDIGSFEELTSAESNARHKGVVEGIARAMAVWDKETRAALWQCSRYLEILTMLKAHPDARILVNGESECVDMLMGCLYVDIGGTPLVLGNMIRNANYTESQFMITVGVKMVSDVIHTITSISLSE